MEDQVRTVVKCTF